MYLFLFSETFDSIFRIPAAAVKTGDVSSGDAWWKRRTTGRRRPNFRGGSTRRQRRTRKMSKVSFYFGRKLSKHGNRHGLTCCPLLLGTKWICYLFFVASPRFWTPLSINLFSSPTYPQATERRQSLCPFRRVRRSQNDVDVDVAKKEGRHQKVVKNFDVFENNLSEEISGQVRKWI